MGLDRRRAIVTGGSCGNGCAALKRFVDEGAKDVQEAVFIADVDCLIRNIR